MISDLTSMNLGMPSEPAPKKKAKGKGKPSSHLNKAKAAHDAGDFAGAKKHALNAASALHAMTKATPTDDVSGSAPC